MPLGDADVKIASGIPLREALQFGAVGHGRRNGDDARSSFAAKLFSASAKTSENVGRDAGLELDFTIFQLESGERRARCARPSQQA